MMTNSKWFQVLLIMLFSCDLYSSIALAQEVETADDVKENFKKDKTGTNPLNFTHDARLYNEYRWLNTKGDGSQNLLTAEYRTPFAGGKWQARVKVRRNDLKADFNNDGFDDVDEGGMGDTDIRFATVPYFNMEKKMAVFTGVEFFSAHQDLGRTTHSFFIRDCNVGLPT